MPVITVSRLLWYVRAAGILFALGALVSISGCAAYPAGGYSDLGSSWPYYGPAYAYEPGFSFGYSDLGVFGLGFDRDRHFHHFDDDFDRDGRFHHFGHDFDHRFLGHRFDEDQRFHGQAMMGQPGHPGFFHEPTREFHGSAPNPGFNGGGGFHARAASPAPAPGIDRQ